ncbi:hypothetical protein C2G38_1215302 [Gigaspora rosea]|uniref:Uncharacterized protein n=1 Tax=Gigaspora rosea TaxID=44941 RepID=A0A397VED8_9GLOM|nr:hypothetical protein C2G38_1215302 [Gigaspora rosea]
MKFHHHIKGLPLQGDLRNVNFEIDVMHNTIRCVADKVDFAYPDVSWLGIHAFDRILSRKQSYHRQLLEHLKSRLHSSPMNKAKQLWTAVDWNYSKVFDTIKY